jgi:hypothetical protein
MNTYWQNVLVEESGLWSQKWKDCPCHWGRKLTLYCQVQFNNIYNLHANRPICQISMLCWVMTIPAACNFKLDTTNTSWIQKLWNYKWNYTKKTPLKVTIMLVSVSLELIHNESNTNHQYISTYDDNFVLNQLNCIL